MKIKLITLAILIYTTSTYSQQKGIEIIYKKAFKHIKSTSKKKPKIFRDLEHRLSCNSNESYFEPIESLSLTKNSETDRIKSWGGGSSNFYNHLKKKFILREKQIEDTTYKIKIDKKKLKWKLHKNQSKTILKHTCYKATAQHTISRENGTKFTYKYTAWYTPSIPLAFGPTEFNGLPGLVLEGQLGSIYFIASEINIKKNIKVKKIESKKPLTEIEYRKLSIKLFREWAKNN